MDFINKLSALDKTQIKAFCQRHKLDTTGTKRQLLTRIDETNFINDEIEAFIEDVEEEMQRVAEERVAEEKREEREARQLELEIVRARNRSDNQSESSRSNSSVAENCKVKISQYLSPYEKDSDIGMYLVNFERLGEQLGVPRQQWATQLIKLLPNEVAAVIARMPATDASDYVKVKETLLNRFKLSVDAFRQRFRTAQRTDTRSHSDFGYVLETNLTEWVMGAGAYDDFLKFREIIALEQYYKSISDQLRYCLLDRKPTTLKEACSLADEFEVRRQANQNFSDQRDSGHKEKSKPWKFSKGLNDKLDEQKVSPEKTHDAHKVGNNNGVSPE